MNIISFLILLASINMYGARVGAQEIDFADFSKIKNGAFKVGEIVGQLRACESANGIFGFKSRDGELVSSEGMYKDYIEYLSRTRLSFDVKEKLENELTSVARVEQDSDRWIFKRKDYVSMGMSESVCSSVANDVYPTLMQARMQLKQYID